MDVAVSQPVIGDPSSHDDGDVLMGIYETYFITCVCDCIYYFEVLFFYGLRGDLCVCIIFTA